VSNRNYLPSPYPSRQGRGTNVWFWIGEKIPLPLRERDRVRGTLNKEEVLS